MNERTSVKENAENPDTQTVDTERAEANKAVWYFIGAVFGILAMIVAFRFQPWLSFFFVCIAVAVVCLIRGKKKELEPKISKLKSDLKEMAAAADGLKDQINDK